MDVLSKEEYLQLIERLLNQQYNDTDLDNYELENETMMPSEWASSKPSFKMERVKELSIDNNGITDLTNIKKDKIAEYLRKCRNIQVGKFLIKISKYRGDIGPAGESAVSMDIFIHEEILKTHLGRQSTMVTKIDVTKDSRFYNRQWLKYFTPFKVGNNIPIDVMIDIIRYLQVTHKLKSFL